jgi:hypothetical protein
MSVPPASITPRRSSRLTNKPAVTYFQQDELDNFVDEQDEQDVIMNAIIEFCNEKEYEYSDELIPEFNKWRPTASREATMKYNHKLQKQVNKTTAEIVRYWLRYYSEYIRNEEGKQKVHNAIVNYCTKYKFKYDPIMVEKFLEAHYLHKWSDYCWCDRFHAKQDVRDWFNNHVNKIVVF